MQRTRCCIDFAPMQAHTRPCTACWPRTGGSDHCKPLLSSYWTNEGGPMLMASYNGTLPAQVELKYTWNEIRTVHAASAVACCTLNHCKNLLRIAAAAFSAARTVHHTSTTRGYRSNSVFPRTHIARPKQNGEAMNNCDCGLCVQVALQSCIFHFLQGRFVALMRLVGVSKRENHRL